MEIALSQKVSNIIVFETGESVSGREYLLIDLLCSYVEDVTVHNPAQASCHWLKRTVYQMYGKKLKTIRYNKPVHRRHYRSHTFSLRKLENLDSPRCNETFVNRS